MNLDTILARNIRKLRKQGWTDKQIASYRRGWYMVERRK